MSRNEFHVDKPRLMPLVPSTNSYFSLWDDLTENMRVTALFSIREAIDSGSIRADIICYVIVAFNFVLCFVGLITVSRGALSGFKSRLQSEPLQSRERVPNKAINFV